MANRLGLFLYCLRRAEAESAEVVSDRHLLERFLAQRDEAAFEELVRRHGPMVLGVCRGLLDDPADVDDAFQATFLVLIRRARTLAWRDALGGWLHQVARRVALRARAVRTRRQAQTREVDAMRIADPRPSVADAEQQDLRRLLDEELDRLPTRLRDPLVLCHLQGKTHEEAARALGCPRGSMDRLLTQAEDRLRDRLTSRGLTLPASVAALLAAEQLASAALPLPLIEAVVHSAKLAALGQAGIASSVAGLAEGVIRNMILNRMLKTSVAVLLLLALLTGGVGRLWRTGQAAEEPGAPAAVVAAKEKPIKPYVVWSGAHSQVRETSYRRIVSAEDWRSLWQVHRAGEAPQIDFDQCMILAIYQGASFNSKGIRIDSITDTNDGIQVRIRGEWYQSGEPGDAVTPYGLFLLPRSAKPLAVEENVQNLIGQPPVWKLRAHFDPPGAGGKPPEPVVAPPAVDVSAKAIDGRLQKIISHPDKDTEFSSRIREGATMLRERNEFPTQFLAPADNQNARNQFRGDVENTQKQVGLQIFRLDTMLEELQALEGMRANEPAAWQTHYDYVRARLAARVAKIYEYNAQLGKMRQELPPRDPAEDKGWQLVPGDNYLDRDAAKYAQRAAKFLQLLAKDSARTPWEDVAKAEEKEVLRGLMWQGWPR